MVAHHALTTPFLLLLWPQASALLGDNMTPQGKQRYEIRIPSMLTTTPTSKLNSIFMLLHLFCSAAEEDLAPLIERH